MIKKLIISSLLSISSSSYAEILEPNEPTKALTQEMISIVTPGSVVVGSSDYMENKDGNLICHASPYIDKISLCLATIINFESIQKYAQDPNTPDDNKIFPKNFKQDVPALVIKMVKKDNAFITNVSKIIEIASRVKRYQIFEKPDSYSEVKYLKEMKRSYPLLNDYIKNVSSSKNETLEKIVQDGINNLTKTMLKRIPESNLLYQEAQKELNS